MSLPPFSIDSWVWKFIVVGALLAMREFVRLLSPKADDSEASETSKWLVETIDSAAIAIGLVLFVIQPFILQAFFIPSGSMEDTLLVGDRLLVSKLIYRMKNPTAGDVVVFRAPPAALLNSNSPPDTDFIKRCIGTPGQEVHMINRQVFRDGQKVTENYTKWSDPASAMGSTPDEGVSPNSVGYSYDMKIVGDAVYSREYLAPNVPGPWAQNNVVVPAADQDTITNAPNGKVPAGKYLFLGDHRNNSNDGHVWGFAPRENIIGKAICVFWPPTRLGLVDKMSDPKPKLGQNGAPVPVTQ